MHVSFLEVNRHRIMNGTLDPDLLQARPDAMTLWSFNHVAMPDALRIGHTSRQLVRRVLQQFRILSRAINASRIPLVEVLEFYREHSRLEAIHAVVIPDFVVQVLLALRVIAQRTRAVGYGC